MAGSEGHYGAGCVRMNPSSLLQHMIAEQNTASPPARSKTKGEKLEYTKLKGQKNSNPALITVDEILLLANLLKPFSSASSRPRDSPGKERGKKPNPTPQTETKKQT